MRLLRQTNEMRLERQRNGTRDNILKMRRERQHHDSDLLRDAGGGAGVDVSGQGPEHGVHCHDDGDWPRNPLCRPRGSLPYSSSAATVSSLLCWILARGWLVVQGAGHQGWHGARMQGWQGARMAGCKDGRVQGTKALYQPCTLPSLYPTSLCFFSFGCAPYLSPLRKRLACANWAGARCVV